MTLEKRRVGDIDLAYRWDGNPDGPVVMMAHAMGTSPGSGISRSTRSPIATTCCAMTGAAMAIAARRTGPIPSRNSSTTRSA